jgi:hypothetical protein
VSQRWILFAARRALVAVLAGALAIAAARTTVAAPPTTPRAAAPRRGPRTVPVARWRGMPTMRARTTATHRTGCAGPAPTTHAAATSRRPWWRPAARPRSRSSCLPRIHPSTASTCTRRSRYVVLHQAARLASTCRVFAPIYRQRTLTALLASLGGSDSPSGQGGDSFADVLDAFRTYMAEDNEGRGFVLVGHSQGARMV